jgi:Rieske Fe-S protein
MPLVAACGGDDSSNPDSGTTATTEETTAPAETSESSPSPTEDSGNGGNAIAKTSDVPVGGGAVIKDQEIVVTQPTAGTFKGFTSICTHKGCPVTDVSGGTINCNCHGSKFKIEDGSVANGPATQPLAAKNVTVDGDSIMLA